MLGTVGCWGRLGPHPPSTAATAASTKTSPGLREPAPEPDGEPCCQPTRRTTSDRIKALAGSNFDARCLVIACGKSLIFIAFQPPG